MAGKKGIFSTLFGIATLGGARALKRTVDENKRAQAVRRHRIEQEGPAGIAAAPAAAEGEPYPESGRKGGGAAAAFAAPPVSSRAASTTNTEQPTETGKPVSAPGAEDTHHDVRSLHGPVAFLKELFQRFNGDHCPAWAAALSFFGILSFFPVLICGIALLGLLIQDPDTAARQVERFLVNLLPGAGASSTARSIIAQANIREHAADLMKISGIASLIGIVSLFWTASRIFVNAATPMNAAFRVKETRGFLKMQLYAIGMLFGVGALFLLSFLPTSGPDFLRNIPFFRGLPDPSPWFLDVLFLLLGVAINSVMYAVIYKFLPSPAAGISWKEAFFAGTIVAVLWEIAKQGFAIYLRNFGGSQGYDKVYGSLGGIIILVLWVYYSSMILLLGAEIAKLYSDRREARGMEPSPVAAT